MDYIDMKITHIRIITNTADDIETAMRRVLEYAVTDERKAQVQAILDDYLEERRKGV